jgi:hypothetical protein
MISTLGIRYKTVATSLSYLSQDAPFLPHPYDNAAAIAINEQSGTADFCRKLICVLVPIYAHFVQVEFLQDRRLSSQREEIFDEWKQGLAKSIMRHNPPAGT